MLCVAPAVARGAAGPQCVIVASGAGPEWSLSLQIRNGRAPTAIVYFVPVMLRGFTVRASGRSLTVAEPAIDMPVASRTLSLSPGQRATVPVLTRLRFRPQSGPLLSADRFVQTIDHSATRVQLAGVFGEGPRALACAGTLEPGP